MQGARPELKTRRMKDFKQPEIISCLFRGPQRTADVRSQCQTMLCRDPQVDGENVTTRYAGDGEDKS